MSHVFISYSKVNWDYARALADRLLVEGFDVWIDDRIDYGEDWWRTIVRAIKACAAFTVVMTPDSDASRWVQREITLADELGKPAYPLLLAGDLLSSENWTMFVRTQYMDVRNGALPKADFYNRLGQSVPRKPTPGAEITAADDLPLTGQLLHKALPIEPEPELVPEPPKILLPQVKGVLPMPFDWCEVPAGSVTIEYTRKDHRTFEVADYAISKYPITNAQFQVFLKSPEGYREPRWWDYSPEAKSWRRSWSVPDNTAYSGDDLPRTNVNWYEAMAYCWWLTTQIGGDWVISLPTEQQWQRAAQGDDGRAYPWGNQFFANSCNTTESRVDKVTPVTKYQNNISPYGVMDMAGNVWEWCLTEWGTDSTNARGSRARVLRGGSWRNDADTAKNNCRDYGSPEERFNLRGFRVVTFLKNNN